MRSKSLFTLDGLGGPVFLDNLANLLENLIAIEQVFAVNLLGSSFQFGLPFAKSILAFAFLPFQSQSLTNHFASGTRRFKMVILKV